MYPQTKNTAKLPLSSKVRGWAP